MTSYERLMNAVTGGLTDRTPIAPEIFGLTARLNGYKISQYVKNGRVIAESQLKARESIGYDILFAFADLSVEAEALGCLLHYEEDAYPSIRQHIIRDLGDLKDLRLPDPLRDGRMPVVIEACARLRESVKNECIIAACVMGPVSIASQIMGIEKFLYQLVDNPDEMTRVLDFTEKVAARYGAALIQAGAHCPVVFDPVASPVVIPPSLFLKHEAPRLKRLYDFFRKEGSPVSWISIAGTTQKIMPYFKETGINLATVDYVISISDAFELAPGIAVNGNIKPYAFVSSCCDEIKKEVKKCLREAEGRENYIVGSGCEVPLETKIENIRAVVEAVEEFSAGNKQ